MTPALPPGAWHALQSPLGASAFISRCPPSISTRLARSGGVTCTWRKKLKYALGAIRSSVPAASRTTMAATAPDLLTEPATGNSVSWQHAQAVPQRSSSFTPAAQRALADTAGALGEAPHEHSNTITPHAGQLTASPLTGALS